jgi:hypothetical protein
MRKKFCSADVPRITAHMRLPAFRYSALGSLHLAAFKNITGLYPTAFAAERGQIADVPVAPISWRLGSDETTMRRPIQLPMC